MAKRIGPEAKIITLCNSLSDDGKRIVLDVIKSQASAPRKASTKKQVSAPAPLLASKEPIPPGLCSHTCEDGRECLSAATNTIHDKSFGYAGYHPFEPPKSVARATRKSKQKSESTPSIQSIEGETENVLAASSGGD